MEPEMKIKLLGFLIVVVTVGTGLGVMTRPPSDAPQPFRDYCAGRCHISPTSVLSGKRHAFLAWAELSRVDRGLQLCTMGLALYDRSRNQYDPSRKGIPLAEHEAILRYLDHYLGPPPDDDMRTTFASDH
jgi:hypothetical protein